jgi:hypothetical protein
MHGKVIQPRSRNNRSAMIATQFPTDGDRLFGK